MEQIDALRLYGGWEPPAAVAFDERSGAPLAPDVTQFPDNCPGTVRNSSYTYDAKIRRIASEHDITYNPDTCSYYSTSSRSAYDAEDHVVFDASDVNQPGYAVRWNPLGHPVSITGAAFSRTLHYDGDQLLFVSDAQGALVVLNAETLGQVTPDNTVIVNDRDYSGMTVMQHSARGYTPWDGTVTIMRGKFPSQAGARIEGSSTYLGPPGWNGRLDSFGEFNYIRPDGFGSVFGTVQGTRISTADGWTTPDAYAGDVHDPMSQKPFMWNRNNPYMYSDPSGFCSIAHPQTCGPAILPWLIAAGRAAGAAISATVGGAGIILASLSGDEPKREHQTPLSPEREKHILEGDETGGGHAPGTNKPGKSEFPEGWSDEEIIKEVRGVADDPKVDPVYDRGDYVKEAVRKGVRIRVVIRAGTGIWTAYPTNTLRNR